MNTYLHIPFFCCLLNFTVHIIIILFHWMQEEELNRYGELYAERYPKLNVKVVDGSSLAVAVLLNSIPRGTTQVVLRGKLTKVAYALAFTLCQRGIKVIYFVQANTKTKAKIDVRPQENTFILCKHGIQCSVLLPGQKKFGALFTG